MELKDEIMKFLAAGGSLDDLATMTAEAAKECEKIAKAGVIVEALKDYLSTFYPKFCAEFCTEDISAAEAVNVIDKAIKAYEKLDACTFPLRVKPKQKDDADTAIKKFLAEQQW